MHKTAIPNGIFLGFAMMICSYVIYVVNPDKFFQARSLLLLCIIFLIFLKTGQEAKAANGQFISFGQGFKNMFVTGAIGIFLCVFFEYILVNYLKTDLIEIKQAMELESLELTREVLNGRMESTMDLAEEQIENGGTISLNSYVQQYMTKLFMPVAAVAALLALIIKRAPPQSTPGTPNQDTQNRYVINKDREE
jgi:hypothetical protein